ncbi:hypothetical protein COCOBI_11-4520 [Coccomyxa sp. Obi]|nr:hypothetical protein COCOBI_11-4520 [Coccomyxa sp. Obi]
MPRLNNPVVILLVLLELITSGNVISHVAAQNVAAGASSPLQATPLLTVYKEGSPDADTATPVKALEAAVSNAVDSSLPKETLKAVLEAVLDPKRLPQSYGIRSAVGAAVDAGASPAAVKALAKTGIQLEYQDVGRVHVSGAANNSAGPVFQASAR